jgi:hypothetical protein
VFFLGGDGDSVGFVPVAVLLVVFEVAALEVDVAAVGEAEDVENAGVFDEGAGGFPLGVGVADFAVFDGGSVNVVSAQGVPFDGGFAVKEFEAEELEDGVGDVGFVFGGGVMKPRRMPKFWSAL